MNGLCESGSATPEVKLRTVTYSCDYETLQSHSGVEDISLLCKSEKIMKQY